MSYIRIYTAADAYTDFTDIWGVDIDPQSISGATYFAQESQKLVFSMPYATLFDGTTFFGAAHGGDIYRARVELWEVFTYADQNNEIQPQQKLIYSGYIFKDSITIETVGVVSGVSQRIMTLTAYDYLAVLNWYLSDMNTAAIPNNKRILNEGDEINIVNELNSLWNEIPESDLTIFPLWARPPITYAVENYPDYTYYSNAYVMWRGGWKVDTDYLATIYTDGENLFFEYWRFEMSHHHISGTEESFQWRFNYGKYRVHGVGLQTINEINEWGHETVNLHLVQPPAETDVDYWLALYSIDTSLWEINQSYAVPNEDVVYNVVHGTTPFIGDHLQLTITGHATVNQLTIIENTEIDKNEWMNFLLVLQFAWIKPDGAGFTFTNKSFYPYATTAGFTDAVKVTEYTERYDTRTDAYVSDYSFLSNMQYFVDAINAYAVQVGRNYPKVCRFSTNEQVNVGDFVMLPAHNPKLIFITEASYDTSKPFLWSYEGRSA